MTTLEILIAAQELIRNPARWCQNEGQHVNADGSTSYCACGAIGYVQMQMPGDIGLEAIEAIDRAGYDLFGRNSVSVNDTLGHAAVMQMFDEAIRAEREKEQNR